MQFKRGVGRYAHNRRGATAVIFAMCFFPLMLVVGFVVDYGLQQNYQTKVQHALDMAGLAAARHLNQNPGTSTYDVKLLARNFFKNELEGAGYISMNEVDVVRSGMRLQLEVDGTMPTSFMQLAGVPEVPLASDSEIVFDVPSEAEIVLVLDTSHSMSVTDAGETYSRIDALRHAALSMITTMKDPDSTFDVKMAIVPFSNRVNVGKDQAGAAWLSVPPDQTISQGGCHIDPEWLQENCISVPVPCDDDGIAGTCEKSDCGGKEHTDNPPEVCGVTAIDMEWFGCVEPRTAANHLVDGRYMTEQIRGVATNVASHCASPMRAMTDSADELKQTLVGLSVGNKTYMPSGLIWGFRMLTQRAPFTTDESIDRYAASGGIKTLVLMSDGANTLSPEIDGTVSDEGVDVVLTANRNTETVCNTIKDAGVEIYVVAYDITDVTTTALLKDCASSETRFFTAGSSHELVAAFDAITQQLSRDISIVG